jgi:hypothetical protein
VLLGENSELESVEFPVVDLDKTVAALRNIGGLTAFADENGQIYVSFFDRYSSSLAKEVDETLSSLGLEPALAPIIYGSD